jgi:hypothetical protein
MFLSPYYGQDSKQVLSNRTCMYKILQIERWFEEIYFVLLNHGLIVSAPSLIIYDNCCNFHNYCLGRDALFFENSRFVVDRLHWKNHTGNIVQ